MTKGEALQIFDGAMLGDAKLQMNGNDAQFDIALSGAEHLDWLCLLGNALKSLGVELCLGYPKLVLWTRSTSHGEKAGQAYVVCRLTSRNSAFLTTQFHRWYRRGCTGEKKWVKIVPRDLYLTPIILANWHTGDGSARKDTRISHSDTVNVTLSTHAFTIEEISFLEHQLQGMELDTGRGHSKVLTGSGVTIEICQGSVNEYMNVIRPHVVFSYLYKIIERIAISNQGLAIQRGWATR